MIVVDVEKMLHERSRRDFGDHRPWCDDGLTTVSGILVDAIKSTCGEKSQ